MICLPPSALAVLWDGFDGNGFAGAARASDLPGDCAEVRMRCFSRRFALR